MSIYTALVGTIAQQGQAAGGGGGGGSAPTSVSTATSSTGNFDNAVIVVQDNGIYNSLAVNSGSLFSSNAVNLEFIRNSTYLDAVTNNSGVIEFFVQGYIRATGATSFEWKLALPSVNDSIGAITSSAIQGTASTDQDETTGSSGHEAHYTHASGGRGYQILESGDDFIFVVSCYASNSNGTTSAATLSINIEVV